MSECKFFKVTVFIVLRMIFSNFNISHFKDGPRDCQHTGSGQLCYIANVSCLHWLRQAVIFENMEMHGTGVPMTFCAMAANSETVDNWLCSLERLLVLLYDCTSSQECVKGARKQFTQT